MTPAQLRVRDQAEKLLAFKPGMPIAIVADAQLEKEVWVEARVPKPPVLIGVATPYASFVLEVGGYDGMALLRWVAKMGGKAP